MEQNNADLVVIGAGPGGYAAAFRAADLGRDVVLVDARDDLGGVCLNEGCIPSKALLHAAEVIQQARHMSAWGVTFAEPEIDLEALRVQKDKIVSRLTGGLSSLAKRRRVKVVQGFAQFLDAQTLDIDGTKWRFEQAIIAVGSSPIQLPGWPHDDNRIWDSAAALELRFVPRRLAIVGGGIIGLEMATVYTALGSQVTVVELADQIAPGADPEAVAILHDALKASGVVLHTRTRTHSVTSDPEGLSLFCEGGFNETLQVDAVIQAVGRASNAAKVMPESAGIALSDRGVIPVDERCQTNQPHIFAVGDVTGMPMLAHRASHQGHVAAEVASGHATAMDTTLIPAVAYTAPELAWVGLTAKEAQEQGVAFAETSFPWAASGRNLASGGEQGLTKLVYCPESQRVLGASIVGPAAGELISEVVVAMEMGACLEDLSLTVHAHPTLSETIPFAAARALGTLTDL